MRSGHAVPTFIFIRTQFLSDLKTKWDNKSCAESEVFAYDPPECQPVNRFTSEAWLTRSVRSANLNPLNGIAEIDIERAVLTMRLGCDFHRGELGFVPFDLQAKNFMVEAIKSVS